MWGLISLESLQWAGSVKWVTRGSYFVHCNSSLHAKLSTTPHCFKAPFPPPPHLTSLTVVRFRTVTKRYIVTSWNETVLLLRLEKKEGKAKLYLFDCVICAIPVLDQPSPNPQALYFISILRQTAILFCHLLSSSSPAPSCTFVNAHEALRVRLFTLVAAWMPWASNPLPAATFVNCVYTIKITD